MHRTNEANLSSNTDNLEKLRESFGQWVNLSIESECKVIVTSCFVVDVSNVTRCPDLSSKNLKFFYRTPV